MTTLCINKHGECVPNYRPEGLGFVTAIKQPKPTGFVTVTTQF